MTPLSRITDRIGYETIAKHRPRVIEAIIAALDQGATARQIEAGLIRRFGQASLTAQMAVGAAYYLEAQRKETKL